MGKMIKKGLSYLLTVAMVLGMFTWGPLAPDASVKEAKAAVIPEKDLTQLTDRVVYHGINDEDHTAIGIKRAKRSGCYGNVYGFDLKLKGTVRKFFGVADRDIMTSYWGLYGSAAKLGTSVSGGKALDVTQTNSLGSNVTVNMTFTGMPNANVIRVGYVIKNSGSSAQTVSVGGTVDTDIAGDDYAKIENFQSGSNVGLISTARGGEYISFSTDGDYWYGKWTSSEKDSSTFAAFIQKADGVRGKDPKFSSRDGTYDSCMSWLWKGVSVPAGKTVTKYCYWGVGDLTEGDDPEEIKTAAAPATVVWDANADGDTVTGLPAGGRSATDDNNDIKLPTPTRNGYVFEGWFDKAAAGNKIGNGGATYHTEENITLYAHWKAIVSTVNVKLKMGSTPYGGQTVQLYSGDTLVHSLLETETEGTYTVNGVVNGTYQIAVNGTKTGDQAVVAATSVSTTQTIVIDVSLKKVTITTKLDGTGSDAPGAVTLCQNGKVKYSLTSDGNGEWKTGVVFDASTSFDVYVGGIDTGKDVTKNDLSHTIEYYTVKVTIHDDEVWDNAIVTLRDSSGKAVASLPYKSDGSNTAVYEKILPKSNTSLKVDVGGVDTGETIKVGTNNEAVITFYTAKLNVTCTDRNLPMQATMTGGGRSYAFSAGEAAGNVIPYTVKHVLSGTDYTIETTGISTEGVNTSLQIKDDQKTANLTVNVVNFKEYISSGEENKYTARDSGIKDYVASGGKVKAPEIYLSGYTFDGWSTTKWTDNNDEPQIGAYTAFDFTSAVNEDKVLYPHYLPPTVRINAIVRTNEDGTVNTQGTDKAYRLGNLSISGFDQGERAIRYVILTGTNIAKIEAKNLSTVGATFDKDSGILEFSPLVSMAKAQEYVRENVVVSPTLGSNGRPNNGTITVTVIDKNGSISSGSAGSPAKDTTGAKELTSSSSGKTLSGGFWYVDDETVTCTNSTAGGSGITISGEVYLYIKEGCTLTATGAAGSGQTGGGAGINVPSTATLYLLGEGSVVATGGKAADGTQGATNQKTAKINESGYQAGTGGAGGNGGGGAGAGIGGKGGTGGNGGSAPNEVSYSDGSGTSMHPGSSTPAKGTNGEAGGTGETAGTIYISHSLFVTATTGSAGTTLSQKKAATTTPDSTSGNYGVAANSTGYSSWSKLYFSGRGGVGGNGAGGKEGSDIGGGGAGGGGGGSGGSGSFSACDKGFTIAVDNRANGGAGGNGSSTSTANNGESGTTGRKYDDDWPSKTGGTGGNGGVAGSAGGNGTLKIQSGATVQNSSETAITGTYWDGTYTEPSFSISYAKAEKADNSDTIVGTTTGTYTFGSATTFILPAYTVANQNQFFRGWKLTKYGVELGSVTDNPLASGTGLLYPARKEFTTTVGTAGALAFTAVVGERSGLYAVDTADYNTTPVKTYTVKTKVGDTIKDVGALTFTYTDNSEVKSEQIRGLNGVYTFSNPVNNVTVKHGDVEIATMTASDENSSVEETVPFETTSVTVKGYKPSDVTLEGGPVLTRISEDDTNKIYVYESEYRKEKEEKGNYDIHVDGTDVGKKAKYGSNTTVAYHTLTIKLSPSTASNVILKSTDGTKSLITKKVGEGQSNTFIYTLPEDTGTSYDIYADGTKTGATGVKFDATKTVTADYYVTTVTINLDDAPSDEVGIPYFGSEPMTAKSVGVYSYAWDRGTAKDITISGNIAKEGCASGSSEVLNYYSITYAKAGSETGTVPPNAYCLAGGDVNLSFNTLKNGAQNFGGWSINRRLYREGAKYPGPGDAPISSTKTATATWARQSLNELDEHGKGATVIFDKTVFGYDGTEQKPVIEVYYGVDEDGNDIKLTEGNDYELTYLNDNTETSAGGDTFRAGTVTVTITGKGDYSGVLSKPYTIMPRLVMIKGLTAEARAFNGSKDVSINTDGAELSGVATADNNNHAKIWFDGLSGTVDSPDVEFDEEGNIISKPVRLKKDTDGNYLAHLTGTHKSNYALAGIDGDSVTVKIEKKAYSIKANSIKANNKAYDGTTKATIKQGSAEFEGDNIPEALKKNLVISYDAEFDNADVGTGKNVTITNIKLLGDAAKNYEVSTQSLTTTANIVKAAQIKPAPGEGYEIKDGRIEINTEHSTRGTYYEILWVRKKTTDTTPAAEKSGIIDTASGSVEIDWNNDYYIRWNENEKYQPSMYTDVIIDVPEGKKIATLPVAVEGLVYIEDTEQTGVKGGNGYVLSGDVKGTNSGEYRAVATLQPGYVWPDGSEEQQRTIKWTIAKAPQDMPEVQVMDDPMDENEQVIKYPRGSEAVGGQSAKIIEYSQDGGKSWKKLPVDSEYLNLSDEDQGKTFLFRWAGNDNHEPSPAKPVKVGEWVAQPTTKAPSNINVTSAVLRGEIGAYSDGTTLQFEFHEKGSASWNLITGVTTGPNNNGLTVFSFTKNDLAGGKLYEYRAVASKGFETKKGEPIVFRTDSPTEGTISVDINSDSDTPVDVLVTVEEGNDPKDSIGCRASKRTPGSVKFSGLTDGHYNVVVRTLDYTETRMLSISSDENVKSTVFTIPDGKLSSSVTVGEGAPKAAVEGLNEILSEDDRNAAAEGTKEVGVSLEMEEAVADSTIGEDATDKQKETQKGIAEIKKVMSTSGARDVKYIDINLFKTTTELDVKGEVVSTDVRNIGKTNDTVIEIAMPYLLAKTMRILMYRYHDDGKDDGESKAKPLEALPKRASAGVYKDGTFFVDKAAGYIFLYASGFSTFAIGTVGGNVEPGGGGDKPDVKPGGGGGAEASPSPSPSASPTATPTATPQAVPYSTSQPSTTAAPSATTAPVNPTPTVKPADDYDPVPAPDDIDWTDPDAVAKNGKTVYDNRLSLNEGLKVSQPGSQAVVQWSSVPGANRYEIYAAYCGNKFGKKPNMVVRKAGKNKVVIKKLDGKKLKLKKNYKFFIAAYKVENGVKYKLAKSIIAHIVGRKNKKYSNPKKLTIPKKTMAMKPDKTTLLKPKVVLVNPKRKSLSDHHAPKFRYASSNRSIVSVTKKGKIKTLGKGTCYVFIYAKNGYAKKVKITVR